MENTFYVNDLSGTVENTFYREHNSSYREYIQSIENTFYREHIQLRTHSIENTILAIKNTFYRGHIL